MLLQRKTANGVQLVRRSYQMLEELRADPDGPADGLLRELVHERFELHLPPIYPDTQVFRGADGLKRWVVRTREIWGEWRFDVERFIDKGERVVVLVHLVAEGGLSGVRLERDTAHVWMLADGKVVRCEVHLDRAEALEALGLEDELRPG
jgi:ketosteroid isomerase-like protein